MFRHRDDGGVVLVATASTPSHWVGEPDVKLYVYAHECGYHFRTVDKPLDLLTFSCPKCELDDSLTKQIEEVNQRIANAMSVSFSISMETKS